MSLLCSLSVLVPTCNLWQYHMAIYKKKWSDYISSLPVRSTFTYKDKVSEYGYNNIELPSIFFEMVQDQR